MALIKMAMTYVNLIRGSKLCMGENALRNFKPSKILI